MTKPERLRFMDRVTEADILDDLYAQEDGEVCFYPRGTKVRLTVEPQALNVIVPPSLSPTAPGTR